MLKERFSDPRMNIELDELTPYQRECAEYLLERDGDEMCGHFLQFIDFLEYRDYKYSKKLDDDEVRNIFNSFYNKTNSLYIKENN